MFPLRGFPWSMRTVNGSNAGRGAGVFGHSLVVKDHAHAAVELSHGLGDAAHAFGFDGADGEAPQTGHVLRAVTDAYPAASISKHAIPAMSYPSRPQKNRL